MQSPLLWIALSLAALPGGAESDVAELRASLTPDPEIQKLLHALVPPADSATVPPADSVTAFVRNLDNLNKVPKEELIRQLVIFSVEAENMREGITPVGVVSLLDIEADDLQRALGGYLSTPNPEHRREIEDILRGAETEDRQVPSFEGYVRLLRHRRNAGVPLPAALIRRMYAVDPQQALFSLMRVDGLEPETRKELTWSDHVVYEVVWRREHEFDIDERTLAAAKAELERLSQSEEWWVRLYAAVIMRQNPMLRITSVVQRLSDDQHALVKQHATAEADAP